VTDEQMEALAKRIHSAWNSLQRIAQDIHGLKTSDWEDFVKFKSDSGEEMEDEISRVEDRARLIRSRFEGLGRGTVVK
jgi:hypothetical protein